jgi:hypothetical protein
MAKMMMGQIDHARKRLEQLKSEKFGPAVKKPTIKGQQALVKELRAGTARITAPKLSAAFTRYIDAVEGPVLIKHAGNYSNNYEETYTLGKGVPSCIESALATEYYAKENEAEVRRFETETELYNLRKEAITLKATEVEDAIVLGDQHAALVALQEFAAFEV